jgi:haloacetate dehalogenase
LVVWGGRSHTGQVYGDLLKIWSDYADNLTGGPLQCGHYVSEEAPDGLYDWFMKFFPK